MTSATSRTITEQRKWRLAILAVVILTVVVVVYIAALRVAGTRTADWLHDLHWTIAYTSAVFFGWLGLRSAEPAQRPARRWLTIGLLFGALGQLVWNLQEFHGQQDFPAPSDYLFLMLGPCNVMAMIAMLRQHPLSRPLSTLTLDVTVLTIALLAAVIAMYAVNSAWPSHRVWMMMSYPVSTMLGSCIILALIPSLHPQPSASWLLYLLSSIFNGVVWTLWIRLALVERVDEYPWLYLGFSLAAIFMGLGAMMWKFTSSSEERYQRLCDLALRMAPLIANGIVIVCAAWAWTHPSLSPTVRTAVSICTAAVLLLSFIRQSVLLGEWDRLLKKELQSNEDEQSFLLLFRITRGGLAILHRDGRFSRVNPACTEHLGYALNEFSTMSFADLDPQPRPLLPGPMGLVREVGSGVVETSLKRQDGSRLEAELTSAVIPDTGGRMFVILRDITDRKRASAELHALAQRLAIATRSAGIGIWEYIAALNRLDWDAQMHHIWGTTPELFSHTRREWEQRLHPDDAPRIKQIFADAISTGKDCHAEFRIIRPDSELRHIEMYADVLLDEHGKLERMVGVNIDITARKQSEALQAQLEAQLRQSQRLETIGTLTSGIAHDFNNVLGAIMGNIELAIMDSPADSPALTSLKEVRKASQRARDLIKRIVDYGRPQQRNFSTLSLARIIEDSLFLMRAAIPTTVEIRCQLDPNVPPTRLDSSQISQVLLNLCTNAYQAMRDHKGRIDIALGTALFASHANLPSLELQPGLHLWLQVRDNGEGIASHVRPQIFEPFFTTKPPGEGSGLGLSIIRNIMRNHNGAVTVHSEPGEGATFTLYFPVNGAQEVTETPASEPLPAVKHNHRQRVLYLDDEEALVFLVTRQLQRSGYSVAGFTDARTALDAFMKEPGAFDLIITDQSMPGMSGMEVCREVLNRQAGARIIMVSGYLRQNEIDQARAMGVMEIMFKPDTVDELVAVVDRVLSTQAVTS